MKTRIPVDHEVELALTQYYRSLDRSLQGQSVTDDHALFRSRPGLVRLTALKGLSVSVGLTAALVLTLIGAGVVAQKVSQTSAVGAIEPPLQVPGGAVQVDRVGLIASGGYWAVAGSTLYTSADFGATWQAATFPVPTGTGVQPLVSTVVFDAAHAWSVTLVPGTFAGSPMGHGALAVNRTSDGGRTWAQSSAPAGCTYPNAALSFSSALNGYIVCADKGIVGTTNDGGKSWTTSATCPGIGNMLSSSDSRGLLAVQASVSTDRSRLLMVVAKGACSGANPAPLEGIAPDIKIHAPVPPLVTPDRIVVTLTMDIPSEGIRVSFLQSRDGGQTWTMSSAKIAGHFLAEAAEVADGSRLVAVAMHHLSVSADGGTTWTGIDAVGLPQNQPISSLAFADALHGMATAFVGQGGDGLFLTADGGRSWRALQALPTK